MSDTDPDLPGERASFVPATGEAIEYSRPRPRHVMLIPKSIEEQRNIHHNQLRYAELQKLRAGQPNLYNETRYRN
ncbi:hypothetical protein ACFVU2_21150 [Leifsonia sp. NPDC058194]|uniref:hypothetical protein n=1 Tax=Leifsonia sp. NPDC058194 TaxID=3346374 RepID=UPI0036DF9DBF